ncbi:MAG: carboxypeptidase-like regulatory domain-containing protein [Fibrobacter sp.]|jgi:hypothetical protein|nr:carboxypeptidase-like regulatory domain-containing protein [Fibrobacter sp.]
MINRACCTIYILFLLLFPALFFCFCGVNTAGGFETTNGVRVTVSADNVRGKATPGSQIIICDTSFVSHDLTLNCYIDTAYADQNGDFMFNSLQNGSYNLVARSEDLKKGAVITNIDIDKLNNLERSEYAEFLGLGSISGEIVIDTTTNEPCVVYIKGMAIFDSAYTNNYRLPNVPPGKYRIQAYQKITRGVQTLIYSASMDNVVLMESCNETGINMVLELIE